MSRGRSPETDLGGPEARFQTTYWTRILRAKNPESADRREAFEKLIGAYWKPAYFYVRRRGYDVENAKDLTQEYFATFLEKDFLKSVSPELGRFRTFLLKSLQNFLANQYDRAKAKKRGGDFNFVEAEAGLVSADPGPEAAYYGEWAVQVMSRAIERLKVQCSAEDFAILEGSRPEGMAEAARKSRLRRLREKLKRLLIEEVAPTLDDRIDPEEELRELLSHAPTKR